MLYSYRNNNPCLEKKNLFSFPSKIPNKIKKPISLSSFFFFKFQCSSISVIQYSHSQFCRLVSAHYESPLPVSFKILIPFFTFHSWYVYSWLYQCKSVLLVESSAGLVYDSWVFLD